MDRSTRSYSGWWPTWWSRTSTPCSTPDDPGRHLDIIPARGREAPSWADEILTDDVYLGASRRPCLPDQSGRLVGADSLLLPPVSLPEEAVRAWEGYEGRPMNWLHSSANTRERRPRAERLAGPDQVADYRAWLEALTQDHTPAASVAALKVAEACLSANLLCR